MGQIDRECRASGEIIEHDVKPFDSGAVAFSFNMGIDWEFDARSKEWRELPEGTTVRGQVILVKKDGTLNEDGVKQIRDAFNWDGSDWNKLRTNNLAGSRIQVQVKGEMYEQKMNYKASWLYAQDAVPGGIPGAANDDQFAALQQRYGAQTRAICGSQQAPPGRPSAPPPARSQPPGAQAPAAVGAAPTTDKAPWE